MTILPRVASIRASKVSRKNVDDYDIREYDAMTDGSVRGGTNGEIGVWASGNIAFANPVARPYPRRSGSQDRLEEQR